MTFDRNVRPLLSNVKENARVADLRPCAWQYHREPRALALAAFNQQVAAHRAREIPTDREAEARACLTAESFPLQLHERQESTFTITLPRALRAVAEG